MKMNISPGIRNAIIAMAAIETFFALGAIGIGIASLVITLDIYKNCYNYYRDDYKPSECYYLDYPQYTFSLTSQGLWAGIFIIFSAFCKTRFADIPSKSTEQYSTEFSVLAFIMAIALACLDGIGAFAYSSHNKWYLWSLHVTNFSLGCTLFALTLTTMILSAIAVRGCCRFQNQTVPAKTGEIPMVFINRHGYPTHATVGNVPAIVSHPERGMARQDHEPMHMGNEQFLNREYISHNAATQRQTDQLTVASFRRPNTMQLPPTQQRPRSRGYSQQNWTLGVQQSNTNFTHQHPLSIESRLLNQAVTSGMYPVRQVTVPNFGSRRLPGLEDGSFPLQQQQHHSNAAPHTNAHPGKAEQSLQAQAVLPPIQPDEKNLITAAAQPVFGSEYLAAIGGQIQEESMQEQQATLAHQAQDDEASRW